MRPPPKKKRKITRLAGHRREKKRLQRQRCIYTRLFLRFCSPSPVKCGMSTGRHAQNRRRRPDVFKSLHSRRGRSNANNNDDDNNDNGRKPRPITGWVMKLDPNHNHNLRRMGRSVDQTNHHQRVFNQTAAAPDTTMTPSSSFASSAGGESVRVSASIDRWLGWRAGELAGGWRRFDRSFFFVSYAVIMLER